MGREYPTDQEKPDKKARKQQNAAEYHAEQWHQAQVLPEAELIIYIGRCCFHFLALIVVRVLKANIGRAG